MVNCSDYLTKVVQAASSHGVLVRFVANMPEHVRPTPVRGAFRMGEVLVPKDNPEEALFTLLHGLGHMAQWSLFPEEHEQSYFFNSKDNAWGEGDLQKIWDHEWGALPFALGFLQAHDLEEITRWYFEYFVADQYYLASIFKDNSYGLSKFYQIHKSTQDEPLEVSAKDYPLLKFDQKASTYICIV